MFDDHPPIAECNAEFLKGSFQNIDKNYFKKLPSCEPWNNKKGRLNIDYLTYASFKNRSDLIDAPHESFVGIAQ